MRDEELTQLIGELSFARQSIVRELESFLGDGFTVSDDGMIDIAVKKGQSSVKLASILPPKISDRTIRILEREAILNATGLEYIELRSKYRQMAERLQSLSVGHVVYEK